MKTTHKSNLMKLVMLAMLVAIGVVISPILRVEGMCPMAHFINIVCAVLLGPWYSLLCAVLIGIIRMTFMAIPPLALTGAVFGAFLCGMFYRLSKGKLIAVLLLCFCGRWRKTDSLPGFRPLWAVCPTQSPPMCGAMRLALRHWG